MPRVDVDTLDAGRSGPTIPSCRKQQDTETFMSAGERLPGTPDPAHRWQGAQGVTIAGSTQAVGKTTATLLGQPSGPCGIWGSGLRAKAADAAYANAVAAHALELDDINTHMVAHPSIQLLPGLFALAEDRELGGMEIMQAYRVGFEVGIALASETQPGMLQSGWFTVSVL